MAGPRPRCPAGLCTTSSRTSPAPNSLLAGEANPEVDITGRDHVRNDIGALNERWVEHLRAKSPAEMLAMFRDTIARRKATLSAMPGAEWSLR